MVANLASIMYLSTTTDLAKCGFGLQRRSCEDARVRLRLNLKQFLRLVVQMQEGATLCRSVIVVEICHV